MRVLVFFSLLLSMYGCSILDTGPKIAEDTLAMGKAVAMEAFKDLQAQQGMAGVTASVDDPEYYMELMTGPVYYLGLRLGIRRVDMRATVQASLTEDPDVTQADIDNARYILMKPDLNRERREAMLMDLTKRGVEFWENYLRPAEGSDDRTIVEPSP